MKNTNCAICGKNAKKVAAKSQKGPNLHAVRIYKCVEVGGWAICKNGTAKKIK